MSKFTQIKRTLRFYGRFLFSFTTIGFYARRIMWDKKNQDLTNQVWLVTGATGGIGRAVVLEALKRGAQVIAIGRNEKKLSALTNDAGEHSNNLILEKSDLSLQAEMHKLIPKLVGSERKVDVLVNNVGILNNEFRNTIEGHEITYVTNLLNQHLLTEGLIDGNAMNPNARIINVASGGLYSVPLNTIFLDQAEKKYNGTAAYASHKRAQLALSDYYQTKYENEDVQFYTMHPGWVDTAGVRNSLATFRKILQLILRNGKQGADTIIWLGSTVPAQVTDQIWFDRKARTSHVFNDSRKALASVNDIADYLNKDIERFKNKSYA